MHKIYFTISFISRLYMFRAHVLIIRRSKLHYTASGIVTPIGGRLVHETVNNYQYTLFNISEEKMSHIFPHLSTSYCFISVFNQLDAQNLFHNKFYFMSLHVSSTCAHYQEVKIALHNLWHRHTYRWPSRAQVERGLVGMPEVYGQQNIKTMSYVRSTSIYCF
jgi:hypothetical protein